MSKVQNYSSSIELKKQQLASLETAVAVASNLFQNARVEYIDVLFAQRDRNDARMVLIDTKREQLSAIVNAYQALGGGQFRFPDPPLSEIGRRPPTKWLPEFGNRFKVERLPVVGPSPVVPALQLLPPAPDEPEPVPQPQPQPN